MDTHANSGQETRQRAPHAVLRTSWQTLQPASWRRRCMSGVLAGIALFTTVAQAQTSASTASSANYPNRPIKMVVPYAAGGFTDQATRVVAEAMSKSLGQSIVIDSRAGGGGRIGADAVSRANPDGYELLMTTNGTHTYMAVTEKT